LSQLAKPTTNPTKPNEEVVHPKTTHNNYKTKKTPNPTKNQRFNFKQYYEF
jgi:hypothetical protein